MSIVLEQFNFITIKILGFKEAVALKNVIKIATREKSFVPHLRP